QTDEINSTLNVSLSGFYFSTRENYKIGSRLQVAFPYWAAPGSINREYPARVTRLDPLPDGSLGVAVEFLESLRNNTPSAVCRTRTKFIPFRGAHSRQRGSLLKKFIIANPMIYNHYLE